MARTTTLKGSPVALEGNAVAVGQAAPDAALSPNLKETVRISDHKGRKLVLVVVPSLDTPVCDIEGQRFNKEAASLGKDVDVLVISMDLPPAQARWCGANKIENVKTLSDYKLREFGKAWGTYIPELGIECRAVFVVDASGKVAYVEYVPEIAQEPNYDAALAAVRAL